MINHKLLILWLFILALGGETVEATDLVSKDKVLTIRDSDLQFVQKKIFLGEHLYILRDSTGLLTLEDVQSPEIGSKFYLDTLQEITYWNLDLRSSVKAVWGRITLHSKLDKPMHWLLSISAGDIQLFTPNESGKYIKLRSGMAIPISEKHYKNEFGHMSFFPFEMEPGSTKTLYFRGTKFSQVIGNIPYAAFNRFIFAPEAYVKFDTSYRFWTALFLGIMLAVFFYHLIIYAINRRTMFLLFSLVVLVQSFSYFLYSGFFVEIFFHEITSKYTVGVVLNFAKQALFVTIFYLFSKYYLNLKKLFPTGNLIWIILVVLTIALKCGIIAVVLNSDDPVNSEWHSQMTHWMIHRVLHILISTLTLIAPIVCYIKGNKKAWIYLLAFMLISYQQFARTLNMYHILEIPFINPNGLEIVIGILLFAFGIALLIRDLEKEKTTAEQARKLLAVETSKIRAMDDFKTRYYINITHEFRTPLTIILGMVDQIKTKPSEWYDKGLEMIQSNGKKLLKLTNQLLYLSKLESKALPLNMIQADICLYLKYLLESFHSMAEMKKIHLSIDGANHPINMDFDPEKIQVIVSNLLSNAIKFTPDGGEIELHIKKFIEESIPFLQIEIRDTGPGIVAEILPHIFDRYFTLDTQNGQDMGSTGLGLSLTKELTYLLNGTIVVDSIPGEGAVFTVRLPITQSAEQKDWKRVIEPEFPGIKDFEPVVNPLHSPSLQHDNEKEKLLVLIVEDNFDVIKYLVSLIAEKYRVETAENGQIGLEKALEIMPDLVISDVMMPVMDGFEFCSILKTDLRTSHIPVILLTARVDAESRLEGLMMGADAYLAKPFDQNELDIRIQKLIELRKNLQDRYQSFGPFDPSVDKVPENDYTKEDKFIAHLRKHVERNMTDTEFGIDALCKDLAMSRSALYRKFSALTNITLHHFIQKLRLEKASKLLQNSDLNITQVAFETGFKNASHFSKTFSVAFGLSPSEFRQNPTS